MIPTFVVQDKWDDVWSKSSFLDFEAHRSSIVFCCVYVFLLCKEFIEVFFGYLDSCVLQVNRTLKSKKTYSLFSSIVLKLDLWLITLSYWLF
jgi:hypothetical protein